MNWNNLTQAQWRSQLKELLIRSDKALERAIVCIYNNQTPDEQQSNASYSYNDVGFNKFDAQFLSELAKQILSGRHLSAKQKAIARNKMPKYWRQLMVISKAKGGYA